jgi:hypothetical protein
VRLGAILLYPWTMHRFIAAYRSDVILLGWDERTWTRLAFQVWWTVFSLKRLSQRYAAPVVVGIVQRTADLNWLARRSVGTAIADMALIEGVPASTASRS